jgi:hypothetical protein
MYIPPGQAPRSSAKSNPFTRIDGRGQNHIGNRGALQPGAAAEANGVSNVQARARRLRGERSDA